MDLRSVASRDSVRSVRSGRSDTDENGRKTLPTTPTLTGTDLKVKRTRARVTATAIAERMGVSQPTISRLEGPGEPDPDRAQAYVTALDAIVAERAAKLATLAANVTPTEGAA